MNYNLNSNTDKYTPFDLDFQLKFVMMLVVTYREKKNITKTYIRKRQDYSPLEKFYTSRAAKYLFLELLTSIIPRSQPLGSLTEILK